MKVFLLNGSPRKNGTTFTILNEIAGQLEKHGIDTVWRHIGTGPVYGCVDCRKCEQTGACVFDGDIANECCDVLADADGFIVGVPVYYAGPNGALCALLDRMFFRKSARYAFKPAAAVVNCRRGGASASFDRLNKYFTISRMPVVPSQYWNATHGMTPEEVKQDMEGLQTMRTLADNMAWLLKCIAYAKDAVPYPAAEPPMRTNFIR
ncbi:MAG TPA: flavodoxin family protein [Clostridiales bacterium]|nr:flavodoxin family protein [Clostridiales bacterium]